MECEEHVPICQRLAPEPPRERGLLGFPRGGAEVAPCREFYDCPAVAVIGADLCPKCDQRVPAAPGPRCCL